MKSCINIPLTIFFLFISFPIFAQLNIGPMLVYGTETDLGFGVKAEFAIDDKFSISPSYALLSSSKIDVLGIKSSVSEFDANAHYILIDNGNIEWYGLGGLNVTSAKATTDGFSESTSKLGLNIGAGAIFDVSESLNGFAQAKYVVSKADQVGIYVGVYFTIGGN